MAALCERLFRAHLLRQMFGQFESGQPHVRGCSLHEILVEFGSENFVDNILVTIY